MIDSSKQVDASNKPIMDTHIFDRVCNLSVGVVSFETAVVGVGIIGWGINQGLISRGTSIDKNIVTDILPYSSKRLFKTNTFQLNSLQSEKLEIGLQNESMKSMNRIIITPSHGRNIGGNCISRIQFPLMFLSSLGVLMILFVIFMDSSCNPITSFSD